MSQYSTGGVAVSDVAPLPSAQVSSAGSGAAVAREDHVHESFVPVGLNFGADGRYEIPGWDFNGQASVNFNVGELVYMLIYVPITTTYDRIGIQVNTAVAASNLRLGVYHPNAVGDGPGALLIDFGTVATATNGVKEITISQELTPGFYFLSLVRDAEAAVRLRGINLSSEVYNTPGSGKCSNVGAGSGAISVQGTTGRAADVAGGLPGTAPAIDAQMSHEGVGIWLREA